MRTLYDEYTSGILAEYAYCIQLGHDMNIGDTYPIGKIWNGVGNISEILRNRKISVEDEDGEIYTLFFRIIKKKSQILRTTVEIIDADWLIKQIFYQWFNWDTNYSVSFLY